MPKRTVSTTERNAAKGNRWSFYTLEVTNPDGAWLNLGALTVNGTAAPKNFNNAATISKTIDENTLSMSAVVRREIGSLSLAPLRTDSPLNSRSDFTYAPALDLRRLWRIKTITTAWGTYPRLSEYRPLAEGVITTLDISGDPPESNTPGTITISGRGMETALLKLDQLLEVDYAGAAIATRLQAMLTRWNAGVTVYPDPATAPSYFVNAGTQGVGPTMPALQEIAQLPGAVLRYMYDAADALRFMLFTPDRTPSVADYVFAPSEYKAIPVNRMDYDSIRNYVPLTYVDATFGETTITSPAPEPMTVTAAAGAATFSASPGATIANGAVIVVDGVAYTVSGYSGGTTATLSGAPTFTGKQWVTSASITRYGLLPFPIGLAQTTNITDQTAAGALADAIRSDLEFPILEQQIESEGGWFVELYDYLQLEPNGTHYTEAQFMGVTSVVHSFAGGKLVTTIGGRGKPAGGYRSWLSFGSNAPRALLKPELESASIAFVEAEILSVGAPAGLRWDAVIRARTKSIGYELSDDPTFATTIVDSFYDFPPATNPLWDGYGFPDDTYRGKYYHLRLTPYSGLGKTGVAGDPIVVSTFAPPLATASATIEPDLSVPGQIRFNVIGGAGVDVGELVGSLAIPTLLVNVVENDQWLALSTIPTAETEVGAEYRQQSYAVGVGSIRVGANIKAITGTPTIGANYSLDGFATIPSLVAFTPGGTGVRYSAWVTMPAAAKADIGLTLSVGAGGDTAALDLYRAWVEYLPTTVSGARVHSDDHAPEFY